MKKWVKVNDFFRQASVSIPATNVPTAIFSEKLPPALTTIVKQYATYAGSIAAWGNLSWDMLFNGAPLFPYNGTKDQIGVQNQPIDIEPREFPPASLIGFQSANAGAAAYVAGIIIKGEQGYWVES